MVEEEESSRPSLADLNAAGIPQNRGQPEDIHDALLGTNAPVSLAAPAQSSDEARQGGQFMHDNPEEDDDYDDDDDDD